mmetsp:Transcript_7208/g.21213  ORF Transcript_7208/g.21213 Transcript_7208/m.21213 type:complete len:454 (+) Transcript_7208:73-1434(+)
MLYTLLAMQCITASAFVAVPMAAQHRRAQVMLQHGGKGFGGGEATRDPEPTVYDPNDPKGKQQAIHKAESFAEYLAKRSAGGGAAPAGGSAGAYPSLPPSVKPGVLTGQAVVDLLEDAKRRGYAIPAVNCVTSSSVNACLEAAAAAKAPVMIQFSSGGAQFYAGKGLDNTDFDAAVAGAVSGAHHVRTLAAKYGVPVILHTDHCAKKLLPWVDGMLAESEAHYAAHGEPLFSSHMLDLSEEPLEENIAICVEYMQRMAKLDMLLEMELGITGGEEDGVDNEDANPEDLYSKPEEIWQVYEKLSAVPNGRFTVAAAFGNVHGVYAPGNVKLDPEILGNAQTFIADKVSSSDAKPVSFVFHGGSGSDLKDIKQAIDYGVVKMNIDTDTQWSYWDGIRAYYKKYEPYLNSQIGNPDGADKPNKKFYDPRMPVRSAEETTVARLGQCFSDLNCVDVF